MVRSETMKPRPTLLLAVLIACGGSTPPPAAEAPASSPTSGPAETPTNRPEPSVVQAGAADGGPATAPSPGADAGSGSGAGGGAAPASTPDAGPAFDFALVEQIVKQHKDAVRVACWDRSKSTEKAYVGTMSLRVGPTGKVVTVEIEGTDRPASQCIEKQVKGWTFPPPNGTATIKVPIRLRRD
jgi:hypothetical protein